MDTNPQNKPNRSKTPEAVLNQETTHIKGQYELILNWYKVNGKNLLGEEILSDLPLQILLESQGNPIWNHIYHCWSVELKHMPVLQPYIKHQFDPEKYVYFIEAYNNN